MLRAFQRKVEGTVGGVLLQAMQQKLLKDAGFVQKTATLPDGLTIGYYERAPKGVPVADAPTLMMLHGLSIEGNFFAPMVSNLIKREEFSNWRFIAPDMIGHGYDLERVKREGVSNFEYPTAQRMVDAKRDLIDALNINDCIICGYSMGGKVAYFLQEQNPHLFRKSILVAPALDHIITPMVERGEDRVEFTCKEDVMELFRNLSCPHREVKDPVPLFFMEAMYQDQLKRVPSGHFQQFMHHFFPEPENDREYWGCRKDIAPHTDRMVLWPRYDSFCNHDRGNHFFSDSTNTIFHSFDNCGHMYHSDGKTIFEHGEKNIIEYLKQER